jgi:hypothetical protein
VQRPTSNTGEKEQILTEALSNNFTVDELRDRLKNNNVKLFLDFLKKLKIELTEDQRKSQATVLEILAR